MKKILCVVLVLLMLLAALVGCKKKEHDPADDSDASDISDSESEIETDAYNQVVIKPEINVDELDYGGANVYILTRSIHQYMREMGLSASIEAADVVDEKIYARNAAVETDLGVKLVILDGEGEWSKVGFSQYITNQTMAGAPATDVVVNNMLDMNSSAVLENFANLNSSKMIYLDTSKDYWNQEYVESAGAYDVLYTIVGDVSLSVYDRMIALFVNNDLLSNTSHTKASLQQLVLDGKWTLEEMQKLIREFGWVDKDSSNTKTGSDEFGIVATWTSEAIDPMSAAFDIFFMQKDANGAYELTYEDDATRINNAFDDLKELWSEAGAFYYELDTASPINHFTGGRALMLQDVIRRNVSTFGQIQDVDFSYSILPLPKYDAMAQDRYQTFSQDMFNVIGVMDCISDERAERTSAVLELMSAKSYSGVRPYYIEDVLKIRYAEDNNAIKILNLVMDGLVYDPAWIHAYRMENYGIEIWRAGFYPTRPTQTPATRWASGQLSFLTLTGELNTWFKQQAEQEQAG